MGRSLLLLGTSREYFQQSIFCINCMSQCSSETDFDAQYAVRMS